MPRAEPVTSAALPSRFLIPIPYVFCSVCYIIWGACLASQVIYSLSYKIHPRLPIWRVRAAARGQSSGKMARRGRPAGFDRSEALQQAMELFWARGYEGATLEE